MGGMKFRADGRTDTINLTTAFRNHFVKAPRNYKLTTGGTKDLVNVG
jgi:hypothetical protein